MAKRFGCWVIVVGTSPTAFRAREREDLLPTLKQLQHTQPETALRWFDRGRIWYSVEEAEADLKRTDRRQRPKPGWRPGGNHVDPKAKYQLTRDQKRAKFRRNASSKTRAPKRG